jgi:predicted acyl esterase
MWVPDGYVIINVDSRGGVITSGGKRILEISVKRYVDAISGVYEHE